MTLHLTIRATDRTAVIDGLADPLNTLAAAGAIDDHDDDGWRWTDSPIAAIVHARAKNDRNGNPRRVFVALDESGHVLAADDEGYAGSPGWVRECHGRGLWELPLDVTPGQYRELRKLGAAIDNAATLGGAK
jgi:hypothetical protein